MKTTVFTVTLHFRTDDEQAAALKELAEATDRTMGWHVRRALDMYLTLQRDQSQAVALRGAIGEISTDTTNWAMQSGGITQCGTCGNYINETAAFCRYCHPERLGERKP